MTVATGKRILVTGGAGFIGASLCRRLLELGHEVICIDDLSTGSYANIEPLLENPLFSFFEQDVSEFFDAEIDRIYHLACPASPVFYQLDPIKTIKTCVMGSLAVLDLAQRKKARILLASTSEIYGNPLVHPQKEEYLGNVNPDGPRSCYDEGKRISETLFFDHKRKYGTNICIARIFNTYGPFMRSDDGRVISNFINQAIKNESLTIYGDGSQTRSFCYVDDTVEALQRLMEKDGFTGPVNIGNPQEISMKTLAEKVISLTGSASGFIYKQLPEDDPVKRCPDITLAKSVLGWQPETNLEDGLKKTIKYFQEGSF